MVSIGKAAWISLASCWIATAGVTAAIAIAPEEKPAVVPVHHDSAALVTIGPGALAMNRALVAGVAAVAVLAGGAYRLTLDEPEPVAAKPKPHERYGLRARRAGGGRPGGRRATPR